MSLIVFLKTTLNKDICSPVKTFIVNPHAAAVLTSQWCFFFILMKGILLLSTLCGLPFYHYSWLSPHIQWTEGGHPGRTGPHVMFAAGVVCRNVPALAQIQLLSMGEPFVKACQCRKAPATHCAQVSTRTGCSRCNSLGMCFKVFKGRKLFKPSFSETLLRASEKWIQNIFLYFH